jgi:hypothetical protein
MYKHSHGTKLLDELAEDDRQISLDFFYDRTFSVKKVHGFDVDYLPLVYHSNTGSEIYAVIPMLAIPIGRISSPALSIIAGKDIAELVNVIKQESPISNFPLVMTSPYVIAFDQKAVETYNEIWKETMKLNNVQESSVGTTSKLADMLRKYTSSPEHVFGQSKPTNPIIKPTTVGLPPL